MTTFTVWKFDDPEGAEHAASVLKDAEADGLVKIVDHAIVTWPRGRASPTTKHTHDDPKRGAGWGALWGILAGGALFAIPVVGGVVGAAIGALSKATDGTGITKDDLERIRTEVVEGTSALFVVTDDGAPRPARRALPRRRQDADQHQPHRGRARDAAGDLRRRMTDRGRGYRSACPSNSGRRSANSSTRTSRPGSRSPVAARTAEEIAARTVNKERARSGEAKQRSRTSITTSRRLVAADCAPTPAPAVGPGPALRRGQAQEHQGPLQDEQSRAREGRRPLEDLRQLEARPVKTGGASRGTRPRPPCRPRATTSTSPASPTGAPRAGPRRRCCGRRAASPGRARPGSGPRRTTGPAPGPPTAARRARARCAPTGPPARCPASRISAE